MQSARVCAGLCVVQRRRSGVAGDAISCGAKSDEEVFGGCILLPACVRASGVSGRGLYLGSTAYGASVCRPGNAYACFVSNTNVINYATPIASLGAEYLRLDRYDNALTVRQFDWSGDAEHTCRFRKYNRVRHEREHQREPKYIWQTYDQPSINAWNIKGFCPRSLPPMSKRQELRRSP